MVEQMRQNIEKANKKVYGEGNPLHFCDSPCRQKKEEIAIRK